LTRESCSVICIQRLKSAVIGARRFVSSSELPQDPGVMHSSRCFNRCVDIAGADWRHELRLLAFLPRCCLLLVLWLCEPSSPKPAAAGLP
jgi:hypothetical protein